MVITEETLATALVDAQPDSILFFKPVFSGDDSQKKILDFKILFCNKKASEVLGVSKEEIINQSLLESPLIDDYSKNIIYGQCLQVWETEKPEQFVYYSEKLETHFHVLRSKVNNGILTITRDRSKEIEAEKKLKEQADLLNSIIDSSINAVFACKAIRDVQGKIIDLEFLKFNKEFLQVIKKSEQELSNQTYLSCFPSAKESFEMNCSVIESGEPLRKEVYYTGDGLDGWHDVSMVKLGQDGLVVSFTDITQSKIDKEAILDSTKNLQDAIDSSQTGITVIVPEYDEAGEIIDFRYKIVNKTFSTYIGKTPDAMQGKLLSEMFPLYKAQGTFARYKKIFQTGESQRFDLHYVKEGYDVWVDILAKKVGQHIYVTFHDYTPLKKAQLQLESMVKDLKRSNTNLEDFAYAASHDLQEPLRKIHFFSDKLKKTYADKLNAEGISMLDRMESATQRMRQLIDDLLVFSQITMKPKEDEVIDLNDAFHGALNDLETQIHEKNATITADILPSIKGDKPQLSQVFQNLISNALKYVSAGKSPFVSIRTKEVVGRESGFTLPADELNSSFHLVEVVDNGIGFDQEDAEKIFNVFQRLHGKNEYSGTGVGLAIVKKVIDNHRGHIMATSTPGEGATFSILFPVNKNLD